jgi:integrase
MAAPFERTSVPGVYRRGRRYVVTYRDPSGRQRKRSAATLAEARRLKSALAADVARGEYREQSQIRFDDYARQWIAGYQGRTSRGIRPRTLEDYRRSLERLAIPHFGAMRLGEIEPRHVKAFLGGLADRVAPLTLRNALTPLRALFATAVEEGLVRSNPCAGLRAGGRRRPDPDGAHGPRALTEPQLDALVAELPPEWRLLVTTLAQTGLRISELVALRWSDIDLDARRIRVRRAIVDGVADVPKSAYGVRDVPISPALARALAAHRLGALRSGDDDPTFTSAEGALINPRNLLRRVVKPAAVRAGVPWAGLHTMRHTCASMLFRSGWNAKQVQMMLGHHSPAFTLSAYVHLMPDDLPEPAFPFRDGVAANGQGPSPARPPRASSS